MLLKPVMSGMRDIPCEAVIDLQGMEDADGVSFRFQSGVREGAAFMSTI